MNNNINFLVVKKMKKYLQFLGFLIVLLTAGYIFLVHTVMPKYIKQMLPQMEAMAPNYIDGSVSIGGLIWNGGLSAEFTDITIKNAENEKITELPRVIIHFRPWLALDVPEKALSKVELVRPKVYLSMNDRQQWNMQHLLKPSDSDKTPFYGLLEVSDGSLQIKMPQGTWNFAVSGNVSGGANPDFAVDMQVTSGIDRLKLSGLVDTNGKGNLKLNAEKLDLQAYASLAQHYANIKALTGSLQNVALMYVNKDKGMRFSGEVGFNKLVGNVTFSGQEHKISLSGDVTAKDNLLDIQDFKIIMDEQNVNVTGEIDLKDIENPSGFGNITAEKLAYQDYQVEKLNVPFNIDKKNIVIENAEAVYGDGKIVINSNIDLEEKKLVADTVLENIVHQLSSRANDKLKISGQMAVLADFSDEQLKLKGATNVLDLQWNGVQIDKIAFDGFVDKNGLVVDNFSAFAGKGGSLAAHGSILEDGTLSVNGRMADFPIDPLLTMATGKDARGLCSTEFNLSGNINAPQFAGVMQMTQAEFMHQKITEAHGLLSLQDNVLKIKDFKANMDQGSHLINGSIDLRGSEPSIDLVLSTKGVRIEPLMQIISSDAYVTGNLDNELVLKGVVSNPSILGEIHASDGSAAKQLFNSVDGHYSYIDGELTLKNFVVNAAIAKVELNGKMNKNRELDFLLDAQNVDLAHLPVKDDTLDLDGLLNAKGYLGGTLTKPYFKGDVISDEIFINGEKISEIQGTLKSNLKEQNLFNIAFKQPYKDDVNNYGIYSADINIDLTEHFLQGNVSMLWGDVGGLLRMARQDYDISGLMQGELNFNPNGKGSGAYITIDADNVKIHERNYAHMNFKGCMKNGIISFDDVKLQEEKDVVDKGIIAVQGTIDFKKRQLDLELASLKANPAILTAIMKDPPEVQGEMDILMQLNGTFDKPSGSASVVVNNGAIAGVGIDSLTAMLSLADDNIKLQQLLASKDVYSIKASGDIPVDLFRNKSERHNANAQMNIIMDLDEARLGILPAMTEMVEWGIGDTKGKIRVAGTLEEPLLFGSVKVDDGSLKIKDLDTVLENINLDVDFQGNQVLLRNLSTQLGKGQVVANGNYALHTDANVAYRLHITAKDAELMSSIFSSRINSEIDIMPQKYRDYRNYDGSEPPEQYRPSVKGNVRLDDVKINMPTIPALGEGESNIGFDLNVELGPKIHLYNSYLYDIWLSGGIHLKGSTLYPIIEGSIKADKGTIKYLRTDFKLNKASLVWVDQGTFLPNVNLDSMARFNRYHVFMRINGPVSEMDLQLSSDPPLEKNTIIRMLTLQRESAGSNEVTSEDMTNLMTAGLQMTVLGDVEMMIKQTLGVDQFRIYTGRTRSGIGFESTKDRNHELTDDERNQYNVLISKYLNDKFMLGYTTSFDGKYRSIFGQYDINRHFNITYSRSYDLSDEAEDWYGLEYKVTF